MKKILTVVLALVLVLSLAACSSAKKKEATGAYNALAEKFNEVVTKINDNPGVVEEATVNDVAAMSETLNLYREMLEDGDLTGEKYDELINWFRSADGDLDRINEVVDTALEDGEKSTK